MSDIMSHSRKRRLSEGSHENGTFPKRLPPAHVTHRVYLADATIPVGELRQPTHTIEHREYVSYCDRQPTLTQAFECCVDNSDVLCLCHSMNGCDKTATLHLDRQCTYCHGWTAGQPPAFKRYYPVDEGWWFLREAADELRQIAGLPALDDTLSSGRTISSMQADGELPPSIASAQGY